jgi:hypothetical protein
MSSIFTESDILRYIYGETTSSEVFYIKKELKKNASLRAYYERMTETRKQLEAFEEAPDPTSVNIILEYSASHHHDSMEHH